MKKLSLTLMMLSPLTTLAARDWVYYQVEPQDTLEIISRSFHGNKSALKNAIHSKQLPAVGKYLKLPKSLIRIKCNTIESPRTLLLPDRTEKVTRVSIKQKINDENQLLKFLNQYPKCLKDFRYFKNSHFVSYQMLSDTFSEKSDGDSTVTSYASFTGAEYQYRHETSWRNPYLLNLRARVTKGKVSRTFTTKPYIDFELGLGKVLQTNKNALLFKLYRNEFEFASKKGSELIKASPEVNYIGAGYEHILNRFAKPWLLEANLFYAISNSYKPEVDGSTKNLKGYGLRLSGKIFLPFQGYEQIFVSPVWQFTNFSAEKYTVNSNQLAFAIGIKF